MLTGRVCSLCYSKFTNMEYIRLCLVLVLFGTDLIQSDEPTCNNEIDAVNLLGTCRKFFLYFGQTGNPLRTDLQNLCREYDETVASCATNETLICSNEIKESVTQWVAEYRGRFCEPGTNNISDNTKENLAHVDQIGITNLTTLFLNFVRGYDDSDKASCVLVDVDPSSFDEGFDDWDEYTRYYNALMRCYRADISYADMPDESKSLVLYFMYISYPIGSIIDPNIIFKDFDELEPRSEKRSSVKVFGDPHLKVYKQEYVTCGAPGWVNYLRNKYVDIRGENTAAINGHSATYMTAVNIGFRNSNGVLMHYVAGNSTLPEEFSSGGSTVFTGSVDEVKLEDLNENMIRFVFNTSGTTIVLARFRHTFMMVVRASDNLLDASIGLLVQGCADKIDISSIVADDIRRKRSAVCDDVDDEVKSQCNFDYTVTGDEELAESVGEVTKLDDRAKEVDKQLTDKEDETNPKDGSTNTLYSLGVIFLCLVISI